MKVTERYILMTDRVVHTVHTVRKEDERARVRAEANEQVALLEKHNANLTKEAAIIARHTAEKEVHGVKMELQKVLDEAKGMTEKALDDQARHYDEEQSRMHKAHTEAQAALKAAHPNAARVGLSAFSSIYLGKPLDKAHQCSRWDLRPLSRAQRVYAALDAVVVAAIYAELPAAARAVAARKAPPPPAS